MKMKFSLRLFALLIISTLNILGLKAQVSNNVVDEVIWVVGDEAILKSDVEGMRRDPEWSKIQGNPYCVIPERIAIQKLFLHQAVIDSIDVSDAEVAQMVEQQVNGMIMMAGSKEKLEEYMNMTLTQIKEDYSKRMKDDEMVRQMRSKLTEDIKVSPAEVRRYFKDMPEDSLPLIPTEVEVEVLVQEPRIQQEEIDRVKETLRGYAERVNSGSISFQALARMWSEDPSHTQGGEIGFAGRTDLDASYANVAFSLTDPQKASKVVESEFGFHIIQLIEKRGDKVNTRHILLRPKVADADIDACMSRLDSIAEDIRQQKFTFEEGASVLSDDKDTRNNNGLMTNVRETEEGYERTSHFQMGELAAKYSELAKVVDGLQTGEISTPFQMYNSKGKLVCAIAKLKSRTKAHRASMAEDFQVLSNIVLEKKREEFILEWIKKKQQSTYIRIKEEWRDCEFEYPGWVK